MGAVRAIVKDERELARIRSPAYRSWYVGHLAALAIAKGKIVEPLFDNDFFKSNLRLVEKSKANFRGAVSMGEAKDFLRRLPGLIDAERMLYLFNRFSGQRPHLLLVEDNQAKVLGRLFRVRVTKLTLDSEKAETLAVKSLGKVIERFRGKPKPRRRK